ncbi:MAG: hypothetical protein ACYC9W_00930 [Candidatus Limnocylindria bacterium]
MPKRKRSPLITSVDTLRALAIAITMLSLSGMTAYAGGHLRNGGAPLQPAAPIAAPATPTTATSGRFQLSHAVTTTTAPPVTITRVS